MKKGWLLLLLLSLGLNVGLGARLINDRPAGRPLERPEMPRNMPGERGPDWWENKIKDRLDHLAEKLDLRPEQVQALGQTQLGAARQMHKHRQDVEAAREELHRLVTVVPSDRDSIQAAIRRLSSRQAVVDSFVTTTMMTEMEILDADQRAQYLEMLSLRKHGRQGRGGRRMGRAAHRPFNDK